MNFFRLLAGFSMMCFAVLMLGAFLLIKLEILNSSMQLFFLLAIVNALFLSFGIIFWQLAKEEEKTK